jgi:hypothetical protein
MHIYGVWDEAKIGDKIEKASDCSRFIIKTKKVKDLADFVRNTITQHEVYSDWVIAKNKHSVNIELQQICGFFKSHESADLHCVEYVEGNGRHKIITCIKEQCITLYGYE